MSGQGPQDRPRRLPRRPDPPLSRLGPRPGATPGLKAGLSRRGLLASGVLAGVLAATGLAVEARARGGTLRLGLAGGVPAGGWDESWEGAHPALAGGAALETLTEVGPGGALRGELAAGWEAGGDARAWTFALREGAAFHDGRPVGAADVAASLARHAWFAPAVATLEPLGPTRLRIVLCRGDADLPLRLADPRLVVAPAGAGGLGSGPYRPARAQPPGRLRLERVPRHWSDGRGAWFDAVEAWALPDPAERLAALMGGHVDAVDPLPPAETAAALAAGLALAEAPAALRALFGRADSRAEGAVPSDQTPHAPGLRHDPLSPQGPLDGGRAPKRWWWAAA